jgi:hypothetical protein
MLSIIIQYYNIILWDYGRICGPPLTETSFCGPRLYMCIYLVYLGSYVLKFRQTLKYFVFLVAVNVGCRSFGCCWELMGKYLQRRGYKDKKPRSSEYMCQLDVDTRCWWQWNSVPLTLLAYCWYKLSDLQLMCCSCPIARYHAISVSDAVQSLVISAHTKTNYAVGFLLWSTKINISEFSWTCVYSYFLYEFFIFLQTSYKFSKLLWMQTASIHTNESLLTTQISTKTLRNIQPLTL